MYYCVGSAAAAVCQKEQSGLNSEGCGAEAPNGLCRPPSRTTVARRQGWCVTDGKSEGCGAEAPNGLCRSSSRTAVARRQEAVRDGRQELGVRCGSTEWSVSLSVTDVVARGQERCGANGESEGCGD